MGADERKNLRNEVFRLESIIGTLRASVLTKEISKLALAIVPQISVGKTEEVWESFPKVPDEIAGVSRGGGVTPRSRRDLHMSNEGGHSSPTKNRQLPIHKNGKRESNERIRRRKKKIRDLARMRREREQLARIKGRSSRSRRPGGPHTRTAVREKVKVVKK